MYRNILNWVLSLFGLVCSIGFAINQNVPGESLQWSRCLSVLDRLVPSTERTALQREMDMYARHFTFTPEIRDGLISTARKMMVDPKDESMPDTEWGPRGALLFSLLVEDPEAVVNASRFLDDYLKYRIRPGRKALDSGSLDQRKSGSEKVGDFSELFPRSDSPFIKPQGKLREATDQLSLERMDFETSITSIENVFKMAVYLGRHEVAAELADYMRDYAVTERNPTDLLFAIRAYSWLGNDTKLLDLANLLERRTLQQLDRVLATQEEIELRYLETYISLLIDAVSNIKTPVLARTSNETLKRMGDLNLAKAKSLQHSSDTPDLKRRLLATSLACYRSIGGNREFRFIHNFNNLTWAHVTDHSVTQLILEATQEYLSVLDRTNLESIEPVKIALVAGNQTTKMSELIEKWRSVGRTAETFSQDGPLNYETVLMDFALWAGREDLALKVLEETYAWGDFDGFAFEMKLLPIVNRFPKNSPAWEATISFIDAKKRDTQDAREQRRWKFTESRLDAPPEKERDPRIPDELSGLVKEMGLIIEEQNQLLLQDAYGSPDPKNLPPEEILKKLLEVARISLNTRIPSGRPSLMGGQITHYPVGEAYANFLRAAVVANRMTRPSN